MSHTRRIITAAVCIALCVVLPLAFHTVPSVGSLISPMHIPVLLCGIICGPVLGVSCGVLGTLLSSVITQMPPMAYLPSMMTELAVYGFASGLFMKLIRTGKYYADIYLSLILSMLMGRIAAGLMQALVFSVGDYSFAVWISSYFIGTLPAIAIQLIFIPSVAAALKRAKLVMGKY